jgi:hypothetical protein
VPLEEREYAYHDRVRTAMLERQYQQSLLWPLPPPPATPELRHFFQAQHMPLRHRDASETAQEEVRTGLAGCR